MKQTLTELKGETDKSTTAARDSNILLSVTDIRPEQQIQGEETL